MKKQKTPTLINTKDRLLKVNNSMAKRMIEKRMIEIIQICQYKIDIST